MLWLKNIFHSNDKIVIALKTSYNMEYFPPNCTQYRAIAIHISNFNIIWDRNMVKYRLRLEPDFINCNIADHFK